MKVIEMPRSLLAGCAPASLPSPFLIARALQVAGPPLGLPTAWVVLRRLRPRPPVCKVVASCTAAGPSPPYRTAIVSPSTRRRRRETRTRQQRRLQATPLEEAMRLLSWYLATSLELQSVIGPTNWHGGVALPPLPQVSSRVGHVNDGTSYSPHTANTPPFFSRSLESFRQEVVTCGAPCARAGRRIRFVLWLVLEEYKRNFIGHIPQHRELQKKMKKHAGSLSRL